MSATSPTVDRAVGGAYAGARAGLRALRQLPLGVAVALGYLALVVFAALFARLLVPTSADTINLTATLQSPSPQHLFGTDELGRDVFARVALGAQPTAIVAVLAIVVGGGVGGLLAILAGYFEGWGDSAIMRAADASLSFPVLLLALVIAVVTGPGLLPILITLSLLVWARFARVVRAEVVVIRRRGWVKQGRVNGLGHLTIMRRHILPHVANVWVIVAAVELGGIILAEAGLSFLGVGIPPPAASWGQMVAGGREYVTSDWWIAVFPCLAITGTVVAVNVCADWLRNVLDPRRER